MRDLPYETRLNRLNIPTLEQRRTRGDMIEVFKILKGYENINPNQFFQLSSDGTHTQSRTRGHSLKLIKPRHRTSKRNRFFDTRVIDEWNRLPDSIMDVLQVEIFFQ